METFALMTFFIVYVAMVIYSVRFPALLFPLSIFIYSYKQISALAVPFFQTHSVLLNYMVGASVVLGFLFNLATSRLQLNCRTREGKALRIIVWVLICYFWLTLLWSPFYGSKVGDFLPYYIIFVAILPMLIEDAEPMLKSFYAVWALTYLGTICLMLSPAFHMSEDTGRMVIHFAAGDPNKGTPLALADMGAYLIITSTLVILACGLSRLSRMPRMAVYLLAASGIGSGLWLAFNSSRGETFASLLGGCLLVALVKSKSTRHAILVFFGILIAVTLALGVLWTFKVDHADGQDASQRYTSEAVAEGESERRALSTTTLAFAMDTPVHMIFGGGARACERETGLWPHNQFVQALGESGAIGFVLLCSAYFIAVRFGLRTLTLSRELGNSSAVLFVSLILVLLIYEVLVLSKKNSLTFVDTYMWISIAGFSFDRVQAGLGRTKASLAL